MDDAGNNACNTIIEQLNDKIQEIYVLTFQEGRDPKKYCKDELQKLLQYSIKNNVKGRIKDERRAIIV